MYLKECCKKIGDGLHGTPKYCLDGMYHFINGNNLINGTVTYKSDTKKVNDIEFLKYKKDLNNHTLLISINGTIGNIAKYNNEKCILGKSVCYVSLFEEYNRDYFFYMLQSNVFKNYLSTTTTGTTIKNISLNTIREFKFCLPKASYQQHIVDIMRPLKYLLILLLIHHLFLIIQLIHLKQL